jgi:1-acyl-sn-glycerol-3-phosphate acyltransferase
MSEQENAEVYDLEQARARRNASSAGGTSLLNLLVDAADSLIRSHGEKVADFLGKRLRGEYEVDEFGFDPMLNDTVLMGLLRPLYRHWFRVEVRGIENVPSEGGVLLVANHSGTIALDSLMTQLALLDDHPAHRHLRMLGANLVFSTPIVSDLARKSGTTLACHADAERLLRNGEAVGVWPEGFKGVGKPFSERYRLQRFGRGGFVTAAIKTRVPIVPVSIVGAEETYPMIANIQPLARILGVPYFPVTPTFPLLGPLGLIPLPSKWLIEFGTPIPTSDLPEAAADDPLLVLDLTDQIRDIVQESLRRLLLQRKSVFS